MKILSRHQILYTLLYAATPFVSMHAEESLVQNLSREEGSQNISANLDDFFSTGLAQVHLDQPYLSRIHKDAYYHPVAISDTGDVVQLQDASTWSVHPSQQKQILYWASDDDIFIKPSSSCFSMYSYILFNRTTDRAVGVNLINPPLPMGEATFRIINIEPYARLVQLSDNTVWQISANDPYFSSWRIGQRILVGVNNNWRTAAFPHIFVNVDLNREPYSTGDFYGYPIGY